MSFADLTPYLQNIYLVEYNQQVKVIVLFGFFLLSLFYKYYLFDRQQPTKIFFVGTVRAFLYGASFLYSWIFWLIMPVMYHPNVGIDNILLFLAYTYTAIFTTATAIFLFNVTIWIPKYFIKYGNIDIEHFEKNAMKSFFKKLK